MSGTPSKKSERWPGGKDERNIRDRLLSARGFTMVELIVVIVILAVVGGTVTVSIRDSNENIKIANAASRALADLRYAQEMAMANRREVDFVVTVASDMYEAKYHDDGTYLTSSNTHGDLIVYFSDDAWNNVSITSSGLGGRLSFNANGVPLLNGTPLGNVTSVMLLENKMHVYVYPSGFSSIRDLSGGGGCGC